MPTPPTPGPVLGSYVHADGSTVTTDPAVHAAISSQLAPAPPAPLVVAPGGVHDGLVGVLVCEDGTEVRVDATLPASVPVGYHHLHAAGTSEARLVIVAPPRLSAPPSGWGWAVQLYAARSARSWGIGDFTDLAELAAAAKADGGAAVLVSPLHASRPGPHQQPSPYSPASRSWLSVLYIDPDVVPGAESVDLSDLQATAQALNASRAIDRDAVWACKIEALERIWAALHAEPGPAFDAWRAEQGEDLESFCTWSALAEVHDGPWWDWPEPLRTPASSAVADFAAAHAHRIAFWAWCQWVADGQLAAACTAGADVVFDVAVGFDAGGADAWRHQDLLVFDCEVGCPPDRRNPDGQCWGLPPFDPSGLVRSVFAPVRSMLASGTRHAAGLRIDHVMGWWRLYWVLRGAGPWSGAYVTYPDEALLAVLRVEAARAGVWVVGEDMGTVPDGVRDVMADIGMLGYRVALRSDPASWPAGVMGAVETHDQATVAGLVTGADVEALDRVGKAVDHAMVAEARRWVCALAGLDPDAPVDDSGVAAAVVAVHERAASSAARLVLATLDDAAGVVERPNMPGTVDEWPNWRIALPVTLHEVLAGPLARSIVATFRAAGR